MDDQKESFLNMAFPSVDFSLYQANFKDNAFMSVVSCHIDSGKKLELLWSRINNLIGTEFQTKLDDEFSRWNIYLVFFISQKISNALKYTIENDTFFVRKIIFDNQLAYLGKDHIAKCLNDHILGDDIHVKTLSSQVALTEPKYLPITQNLLNAKLPLGHTKNEKDIRNLWLNNAILEVGNHEV